MIPFLTVTAIYQSDAPGPFRERARATPSSAVTLLTVEEPQDHHQLRVGALEHAHVRRARRDGQLGGWQTGEVAEYASATQAVTPEAGYAHELALRQFEVSNTRVFDCPQTGRAFFESVIRDHLDVGRPNPGRPHL